MVIKSKHLSSSHVQKEVEIEVVSKIQEEENFINDVQPDIECKFDFYSKNKKIIGEIYAGIEEIKSGSDRKIKTDCFKLIYAEKVLSKRILSNKKYRKILVFVDENIMKKFDMNSNSWCAKAIREFGIETRFIEIDKELLIKLKVAKKLQRKGIMQ